MGSGAITSLPDHLNSEQVINLISDQHYDQTLFDSLKDKNNGCITKKLILSMLCDYQAQQVFNSYCSKEKYCCEPYIEKKKFIKLCRDLKWLEKNYFLGRDAEILFDKAKIQFRVITFCIFKHHFIPKIAAFKNGNVPNLMKNLSEHLITREEIDKHEIHDCSSISTDMTNTTNQFKIMNQSTDQLQNLIKTETSETIKEVKI